MSLTIIYLLFTTLQDVLMYDEILGKQLDPIRGISRRKDMSHALCTIEGHSKVHHQHTIAMNNDTSWIDV